MRVRKIKEAGSYSEAVKQDGWAEESDEEGENRVDIMSYYVIYFCVYRLTRYCEIEYGDREEECENWADVMYCLLTVKKNVRIE